MKTLLTALVLTTVVFLGGCMVARGPAGEIVMGFDMGKMPETVSQLGGAIASTVLGPQMGNLVGTGLALLLGGGAATYGVAKERGRKKADQGREKANEEVIALRGLLKGMGIIKEDQVDPVEPS